MFPLFAGAGLLLAANGQGQTPGGGDAPPPVGALAAAAVDPTTGLPLQPPVRFSDATEKKRAEAVFDGLPLTEVVAWLEKTFPDVNFVLPQRLLELNPAVVLRLRAVGVRDILEAINIATDGVVESEVRSPTLVALRPRYELGPFRPDTSGLPLPPAAPESPRPDADMLRTMRQIREVEMAGKMSRTPPLAYQVMNLREALRLSDPAKIRETLEIAQKITHQTLEIMASDSPGPRPRQLLKSFEYHEGSGVLVIVGQTEAIKVAMDVLRNMRVQDSGGGGRSGGMQKPEELK